MTRIDDLPSAAVDPDSILQDAVRVAQAAAQRARVEIREIEQLHELEEVTSLLSDLWNRDAEGQPLTTSLVRAMSTTGNYVAGSFLDGRLIGAAIAFFTSPPLAGIHSHITGVDGSAPVRGVGYALKLHQRAWALQRGISTITWTFDPLVRRNAHFNITKLGARAVEYLPNFYGRMSDGINVGEESDRLLIEWELLAPAVVSACENGRAATAHADGAPSVATVLRVAADGGPSPGRWDGPLAVLAVPADVEQMRVHAPGQAHEWRVALRDLLGAAMADGARVVGFLQTEGYLVDTRVSAG
jgi:predicted GNAT superfamily acetyltransferase